jgi:putative toxin-antitoxin system antitoxin component (TIGR02293 family)
MTQFEQASRASSIFEKAVSLFEGDVEAAMNWLQTPLPALGGSTPIALAATDSGVRKVENLIGRLEHGIFT